MCHRTMRLPCSLVWWCKPVSFGTRWRSNVCCGFPQCSPWIFVRAFARIWKQKKGASRSAPLRIWNWKYWCRKRKIMDDGSFFFVLCLKLVKAKMISKKLALWYLNHISTMERKMQSEGHFQVKPDEGFILGRVQRQGTLHGWIFIFLCQGKKKNKTQIQQVHGWVGRWTVRKKSGSKRRLFFVCLFDKKKTKKKQAAPVLLSRPPAALM